MAEAPNLLLIGLRGSGKSTIARALAEYQERRWIELDDLVLARFPDRASISEIFANEGESRFREEETAVLRAVLERERGAVIALGGGTPMAPGAGDVIREAEGRRRIRVAYLRHAPATLRSRLEEQGGAAQAARPALTESGALDEIEQIHRQRDPLYRALATRTFDDLETIEQSIESLEGWEQW